MNILFIIFFFTFSNARNLNHQFLCGSRGNKKNNKSNFFSFLQIGKNSDNRQTKDERWKSNAREKYE